LAENAADYLLARRRQTDPEVPMTEASKSCPQMTVIAPRKSVFNVISNERSGIDDNAVFSLIFIFIFVQRGAHRAASAALVQHRVRRRAFT
ncbi:hypothetical protein KJ965_06035, partial [Patescibacteria group bacterium]|nr:hypothetical protein [Patescibacteria group bacterium]